MSDISASDAVEPAVEAPVADAAVETEAFDLDSAVDEFATNAPEEWKSKASKIQSELKNLRASRNELRTKYEAFDGVHADDLAAVSQLVTAIKSGNTDAAAEWMVEAAKGLTGDQFEAKFGFTKAEAAEAIEAADEAPEPELSVEERIQKALDDRDKAHKESVEAQERQAAINSQFAELGYDTARNEAGTLADFKTQMVAQLAVNNHKGDIKAAHEAFVKLQGDWAKDFVQKHSDDQTLSPGQGTPTTTPDPAGVALTPKDKVKARLLRAAKGAEA